MTRPAKPVAKRAYYQARVSLGQTPEQARAEQRLVRALARETIAGRITLEEAIAALGAL